MKVLQTNSAQSSVLDTEESRHNHNESTNLCLLHCISRPGRSIVSENTQPKETRLWDIIREGRKEGVGLVPRYEERCWRCLFDLSPCLDISQQLHASVRTNNLETSLRLMALGAKVDYFNSVSSAVGIFKLRSDLVTCCKIARWRSPQFSAVLYNYRWSSKHGWN